MQSSTHQPNELLARFELFLEDFQKNLSLIIPEQRFEKIRANIITLLQMPPENMPGMAQRLNKLAFDYGNFDWIKERIVSAKGLTYDQFCSYASQFLSRNNARRLAVLVEGVLAPENDFRYEKISKEYVRNLGSFVTVK